jgi:glutamyl-tRNA reductase
MDPKVPPKVTSPNKPPESSIMTQEEKDDFFHQIGKMEKKMNENMEHMEKKMNENSAHMENKMDENRYQMERKMNENQEHVENKMEELKKSMYDTLLHTLDERLPKGDKKCKEIMKM